MLIEVDTIAGGTAPFTIAGTLVEMNANILSAIALAQLVSPGTPCIYSSSSGVMDMRAAMYSAAAPESALLHMGSTQVAHYYGLPHQGGNTPDAKIPDSQMGYERASHFLALAYAGCDIIHVATGNLEMMRLASYEQCVMDNEILGACFRIVGGFEVNEDTLGVDVLRDVSHRADFIGHEQTLRYLRKTRWQPRLTSRDGWETGEAKGAKDMREVAREEVRRILSGHHSHYVTQEQAQELDRLARAGQNRILSRPGARAEGGSMARLQDKVAIVTGGGTGIGRGIALAYAREGAIVVIADRREEKGQAVVNNRSGRRTSFVRADIRSLADIDNLVARTVEAHGRIDILVNNAGVATAFAPFLDLLPEMYDLVADTNLRGTFFVTQRVARVMAQQRSGKIVIISSNLADIARPETCHYMATKGGLKSLTKGLALEPSPYGICVNAIAPGEIYVESAREFFDDPANKPRFDAVPLRRFEYPRDVAGAANFLASSESGYITGTTTVIDGGQSIV